MMSNRRGTKAALPTKKVARPKRVSSDGLQVTFTTEDGAQSKTFDFANVEVPHTLLLPFVAGFAKATGPGGQWRSITSAEAAAGLFPRFLRDIRLVDPSITTVPQITPDVWRLWRAEVESRSRWPGQINLMRAFLPRVDGLPDGTRQALRAKTTKPKARMYSAYSRAEFQQIRAAASAHVRAAQRRIDTNQAALKEYREGREPSDSVTVNIRKVRWTRGALLDHLATTGSMPPGATTSNYGIEARRILGLREGEFSQTLLFPSVSEVFSLLVLFVCEQGYNVSVLNSMKATHYRPDDKADEDPVYTIDLDKPRRGPIQRHFTNNLTGRAAKLWDRANTLTHPARQTLATMGYPTDALFVARVSTGKSAHPSGTFRCDWDEAYSAYDRWHEQVPLTGDDGQPLRVNLRRLRLTEQVLNQRSSQNTDAVSEDIYRRPDPITREGAAATILQGQADALEHARATIKMRTLTTKQIEAAREDPHSLAADLGVEPEKVRLLLAGALDTPTGACLDFTNSPFAARPGEPCPASFFACFTCKNAVATPEQLPRLVTLHDALTRIASAVSPDVWQEDFADHYARLTDLLDQNATPAERDQARHHATSAQRDQVDQLLLRRYDA